MKRIMDETLEKKILDSYDRGEWRSGKNLKAEVQTLRTAGSQRNSVQSACCQMYVAMTKLLHHIMKRLTRESLQRFFLSAP